MTSESQRWKELATHIAAGYAGAEEVEAIVLGGSVARGHADENSDVDIFVFCREFPAYDLRRAAVARAEGERWKRHDNHKDRRRDCFWSGDGRIDVEFVTIEAFEAIIRDVLIAGDISRSKQAFLGGLLDGQVLHGEDLVADWLEQIERYPDSLQKKVVESHLFMDPLWFPVIYARKRGDLLYLCDAICRVANDILAVLFGLNRFYQPSEYKRLDWLIGRFELAPTDLANRLREILAGRPLEVVGKTEQIVEEVFALVEEHMPSIDIAAARAEFSTDTDTDTDPE